MRSGVAARCPPWPRVEESDPFLGKDAAGSLGISTQRLPGSAEDGRAPPGPGSANGPRFHRTLARVTTDIEVLKKTWLCLALVVRTGHLSLPGPGGAWWDTQLRRWARGRQESARGPPLLVEGAVSPGKEQILAISSISLWQRNVCKYIFKGGFCLKNLNEQVCRVMLMGVRTGLRSHPRPCDLQLPTSWLLGVNQEGSAACSGRCPPPQGSFSGLAGSVLCRPLWV